MDFRFLRKIYRKSQISAGPRYTPAIEPGAPNIEIEELEKAFDGLICGPALTKFIQTLGVNLTKSFDKSYTLKNNLSKNFRHPKGIIKTLELLAKSGPSNSKAIIRRLKRQCLGHEKTLAAISNKLWNLADERRDFLRQAVGTDGSIDDNDSEIRRLQRLQSELREYQSFVFKISEFLGSPSGKFMNSNCGLLLGGWGSGKTHFLCDQSKRLLEQNNPVIFLLAKDFSPIPSVEESIAKFTGLVKKFSTLINRLDALGKKKGVRALLIIDGINESDNFAWRDGIESIISYVKTKKHTALLISCRSPFQNSVLKSSTLKKFVKFYHPGFHDIEFDAQTEFFNYYKIPLPEVPLLAEEFSKPLTLKIMCGAFGSLPRNQQRKGFNGISSGQKGMTYILERFIKTRSKDIEIRLNITRGTCWKLIKGDDKEQNDLVAGLAPYMAATLQEYVPYDSCIEIIKCQRPILTDRHALQLYTFLVEEGILQEDELWRPQEDGGSLKVVRLPYQRFGDHIVSRHLLSKHLDTTDENTIRRSLYKNKPIGKIFDLRYRNSRAYNIPSWAEAIIIEFPERVREKLIGKPSELIYYLPKNKRFVDPYADIFISGLFWRSPESFCDGTSQFIYYLVWDTNSTRQRAMFEALVSVATKHDHPYNSDCLYRQLKNLNIAERDLSWSEFIRGSYDDGAVERILLWFEHSIPENIKPESARNLIKLVSLILTTIDRTTRDRATKVLVLIGEKYPSALFSVTRELIDFNDVYVPERLLSACYGVSMSLWHDKKNLEFYKEIVPFAKFLVKEIFTLGGKLSTTHTLVLDYALGIIELAQLCKPKCISTRQLKFIKHPYPGIKSPFPKRVRLTAAKKEKAAHAIHMDFGNYTLGRLCIDRGNYNYDHTGYKKIRRFIEWRILNLGYDSEKFKNVDSQISNLDYRRGHSDAGKLDRYGKKYSWIAYFELYGFLKNNDKLEKEYPEARTTECDIDPSFPKETPHWATIKSKTLDDGPKQSLGWLQKGTSPNHRNFHQRNKIGTDKGPWILLRARFSDTSEDLREYFSYVRGYFLSKDDINKVKTAYMALDHPVGDSLDTGHDTYTFAGEASWSNKFGFHLRNKDGKLTNVMQEAFYKYVRDEKLTRTKNGYKTVISHKRAKGIMIAPATWYYGWESYHSKMNQFLGFHYPNPKVCEVLNLQSRNRDIELVDSKGRKASIYRKTSGSSYDNSTFSYLRKDLLDLFLDTTNQAFIWLTWGERRFKYEKYNGNPDDEEILASMRNRENIYRYFTLYKP